MAKDLKLAIVVGLNDRASKGLQAIGGEVKKMSGGLTSSLGDAGRGLDALGGIAAALVPEIGIPLMILGTGAKAALSGLQAVGGVVSRVFHGVGSVVSTVAKTAWHALEGLAERAKTVALALAAIGVGAVAGLVAVAKTTTDAARALEVMKAQMLTAMKTTKAAAEMLEWAKRKAETAPFEVGDIVKGTTLLELFGLKAKHWLPMIMDMAAAMRAPLDQAIQAVALAMSGGRMMGLRQFGISPSKLAAAGAEKGGGGEILRNTPEQVKKFGEALQKVMQESFGGGVARLFETLTGKITSFKDALFWLKAGIGGYLLPVLRDAVAYGGDLIRWMNSMGVAEKVGTWMAGVAKKILWVGEAVVWTIQQVAGGKGIGETLKQIMPEGLAESIARAVSSLRLLGAAILQSFSGVTTGADPSAIIQGIVDRISAAVEWLTTNVFAPGRIESIAKWLGWLAKMALGFAGLIVAGIEYGIAKLGGVKTIIATIGGYFRWLLDWGKYLVGWVYTNLPNILETIGSVLGGIAQAFVGAAYAGYVLYSAFKIIWDGIVVIVTAAATVITGVLLAVVDTVKWLLMALDRLSFIDPNTDPIVKGLQTASEALATFGTTAAATTAQYAKDMATVLATSATVGGKLDVAWTKAGEIGPTTAGWAGALRTKEAGWAAGGYTAPAMPPTSPASYLPPVTVNVDARGASPTETEAAVKRAMDNVQRTWRWQPALQ